MKQSLNKVSQSLSKYMYRHVHVSHNYALDMSMCRDDMVSKLPPAKIREELMDAIRENDYATVDLIVSNVMRIIQIICEHMKTKEYEKKCEVQSMLDSNTKVSFQHMHAVKYVLELHSLLFWQAIFDRMPNPGKMREAFIKAATFAHGSPDVCIGVASIMSYIRIRVTDHCLHDFYRKIG